MMGLFSNVDPHLPILYQLKKGYRHVKRGQMTYRNAEYPALSVYPHSLISALAQLGSIVIILPSDEQ